MKRKKERSEMKRDKIGEGEDIDNHAFALRDVVRIWAA